MAYTVEQLIDWLKTQDQGAIVEVVIHTSGNNYYEQSGSAETKEFSPELTDYTDLRNNPFIGEDKSYYNRRTLLLGQIDQ